MKRANVLAGIVVALTLLSGAPATAGGFCVEEDVVDRRDNTIDMKDSCFFPNVARVDVGEAVTWENFDQEAHTVTGVGLWGGGHKEYLNGGKLTVKFDSEGTYLYSCLLHPGMVGAVIVGDGAGDPDSSNAPEAASAAAQGNHGSAGGPSSGGGYAILLLVGGGVAVLGGAAAYALRLARSRTSRTSPTVAP